MLFLVLILIQGLVQSALMSTLSNEDINKATNCMRNIHPCIPETLDCSHQFYSTSVSLLKSINELLFMINQDYSANTGSFKIFPGFQSGALNSKASNYYFIDDTPEISRYNAQTGPNAPGWCSVSNTDLYIQLGSSIPFMYEALSLSGRIFEPQFLQSYKLSYSLDGISWTPYKNFQVFAGNSNNKDPVIHNFEPFLARAVRLIPVSWKYDSCTHLEFYISQPFYNSVLPNNTLIAAISSGFKVVVSSVYDRSCSEYRIGLDHVDSIYGGGSWCSGFNDKNQWIMITGLKPVLWKKIAILGDSKNNYWINSFYVMYSEDGSSWNYYKNMAILNGSYSRNTLVESQLDGFIGISIRIHPYTWTNYICAKLEAYFYEV